MTIIEKVLNFFRDIFRDFDLWWRGGNQIEGSQRSFFIDSFHSLTRKDQENWTNKLALICCIGISCIVLNSFYSVLSSPIRLISLPLVVGLAWFTARYLAADINLKR
jgi:hypothetical protein